MNEQKASHQRTLAIATFTVITVILLGGIERAQGQWAPNGNNIYNTNSGSVGIGTTSPLYGLHIEKTNGSGGNGWSALFKEAGKNGVLIGSRGSGNGIGAISGVLFDLSALSDLALNPLGGKVGIGTTDPALPLDVRGNALVISNDARALIGSYDLTPMAQGAGGGIQFGGLYHNSGLLAGFASISGIKENGSNNDFSSALVFTTRINPGAQTEKLRITSGGNVGIGTSSPGFKLDVQGGQVNASGGLCIAGDCKTAWSQVGGGGSSQWSTSGSNIYYNTGNVGIGTSSPSTKLQVAGDGRITGNLTVDGNIAAKYQDVAEWVESSQTLAAGTVVVLDQTKPNQVVASSQAYDTRVAGVISLQPGIALGENGAGKVLVATTGRVRIKVDATRGSIQVGDLLVTSDVAGVAMKSQPIDVGGAQIHRPGTLIGKALEPLAKGSGEILVLLSLQ